MEFLRLSNKSNTKTIIIIIDMSSKISRNKIMVTIKYLKKKRKKKKKKERQ